ncbi:MAG: preprotein translocase subunit SecE [Patescibacteria group bacterium]
MVNIQTYLVESIAEIKKVIWPTRKQTINYTLLVVGLSIGVAIFFGVLDYIFSLGLEQLIK